MIAAGHLLSSSLYKTKKCGAFRDALATKERRRRVARTPCDEKRTRRRGDVEEAEGRQNNIL